MAATSPRRSRLGGRTGDGRFGCDLAPLDGAGAQQGREDLDLRARHTHPLGRRLLARRRFAAVARCFGQIECARHS
jgi:hypothetical protein